MDWKENNVDDIKVKDDIEVKDVAEDVGQKAEPTFESMEKLVKSGNEANQKIINLFAKYGASSNEGFDDEVAELEGQMLENGELTEPVRDVSEEDAELEQQIEDMKDNVGDADIEDQLSALQQEVDEEKQLEQDIQEDKAEVVQFIEDKKEPPEESVQQRLIEENPIKELVGEGKAEGPGEAAEEPVAALAPHSEEIAAEAEAKMVSEVEEIIAPASISEEVAERSPSILNEEVVSGVREEEAPAVAEPGVREEGAPAVAEPGAREEAPVVAEPGPAVSKEKASEEQTALSEPAPVAFAVPETEDLEAVPAIVSIKQNVEKAEAKKENISRDLQQISRTMMPIITLRYVPIVTPVPYMGRWNGFLSGMTYMVSGYALSALYTGVSMVAGMGGYGYGTPGAASYALPPVMGLGYNLGYMGGMSIITNLGLANVLNGSFDGRIPPQFERERSGAGSGAAGRRGSKKNPPDLGNRKDIPLDWAYPLSTPARNKDGEIIEPELNVFIDSSSPEASGSEAKESVHAFLGLRYSTISPETHKLQRMSIRFGFGPSGSTEKEVSAAPSASKDEGVVAGKLIDERNTSFSSAKKYDITYSELNSILRDSRYYADRGYSVYKRNSVTFVKDMLNFVDVDIDDSMFGSSEAAKEAVKEATSEKNEASEEAASAEEQNNAEQPQAVEPELHPDAPALKEDLESDSAVQQVPEPRVVALVEKDEAAKEEAPKAEPAKEEAPKAEAPKAETQVVVVPAGAPKKEVRVSPVKAVVPAAKNAPVKKVTRRGEAGKVGTIIGKIDQVGDFGERLKKKIKVTAGGVTVDIPMIMYRSYLKIFKSPETAIRHYRRFVLLSVKGENRTKDEAAEFFKRAKIHDQAEKYSESLMKDMVMKTASGYDQRDVNMAFMLYRRESKGTESAQITERETFSGLSQGLIFGSIFGGMKQELMKNEREGGLSQTAFEALNGKTVNSDTEKGFKEWVTKFMTRRALLYSEGMITIIRAVSKSIPPSQKNANNVANELFDSLSKTFLAHIFENDNSERAEFARRYLTRFIFPHMIEDARNTFIVLIGRMIAEVLAEPGVKAD